MGKDRLRSDGKKLGVNGFGRIGKLTLWHHVGRKYFDEIVVNTGRQAGTSIEDIAHYAERDSTYGLLHGFLYGQSAEPVMMHHDDGYRRHDQHEPSTGDHRWYGQQSAGWGRQATSAERRGANNNRSDDENCEVAADSPVVTRFGDPARDPWV